MLEVQTRHNYPDQWADSQNCLALDYLKRQKGDRAQNFEQAIQHCRLSLEVHTRSSYPYKWAIHQMLLGMISLDRKQGAVAEYTSQAVHSFQQALEVFTPDQYPDEYARVQAELAKVFQEREGRAKMSNDIPPGLAYPKFYNEESLLRPGKKQVLKLTKSIVLDSPHLVLLIMHYQWQADLSDDEAQNLASRAIAFLSCALYDAATQARLNCQPSVIPNGRRPAWIVEFEKSPLSLTMSDIDVPEKTCQVTIGPIVMRSGTPPGDKQRWENLHNGFKTKFDTITV